MAKTNSRKPVRFVYKRSSLMLKCVLLVTIVLSVVALTAIRKENIEPQSVMAFHVFARTTKVMFALGQSAVMHLMGYRYEKARVELPS